MMSQPKPTIVFYIDICSAFAYIAFTVVSVCSFPPLAPGINLAGHQAYESPSAGEKQYSRTAMSTMFRFD